MSTEYAGTATYHATCTLPSDGDNRNASTWNAPLEDLADRTAWLNTNTAKLGTANVFSDTAAFNDNVTCNAIVEFANGGHLRYRQVTLADANADVKPFAGNTYLLPLLHANRTYTLKSGTPGERVTFIAYANNGTYYGTIAPDSGGSLFATSAAQMRNAAGYWVSMTVECIGTDQWAVIDGLKA